MLNLVVLASGRGSNFLAIQENIEAGLLDAKIQYLLSDKPDAQALKSAALHGIPAQGIAPSDYADHDAYEAALLQVIESVPCDLVVLAGYMKILGSAFIERVTVPILNIHPSLLPSFPGLHAQRQAVEYGVKVSGCTVHFVDAGLDSGPIIAQRTVPVYGSDNEERLAARILLEEHQLYTEVLQLFVEQRIQLNERIVTIAERG